MTSSAVRIRRLVAVGLLIMTAAGTAVVMASAGKPSAPDNVKSTRVYLDDEYRALRAFMTYLPAAQRDVNHLVDRVREECVNVAVRAPRTGETFEIEQEVTLLAIAIVGNPERGPTSAFVRAIAKLKWADDKITQAINAIEHTFVSQTDLRTPNLCADARWWSITGFQRVPASTTRFVRLADQIAATPVVVPQLLTRYEGANERPILRQIKRLTRAMSRETRIVVEGGRSQILRLLGLGAESRPSSTARK